MRFAYDYQGRRVAKRVYNWSGGQWVADALEERRFVWHAWLMLEELGDPSGAGQGGAGQGGTGQCGTGYQPVMRTKQCGTGYQPVRSYTWGLDLAGLNGSVNSLQAAGGIGGLLAVHQAALDRPGENNDVAAGDFVFAYDGNGDVVQVLDLKVADWQDPVPQDDFEWHGSRLAARYEYDAYGNVIGPDTNSDGQFDELDAPGHYAGENAMRFSTKYFDRETGLGYWGYRYYSPALGRFVGPDPAGHADTLNLHEYGANSPLNTIDPLGEAAFWVDDLGGLEEEGDKPPSGGKKGRKKKDGEKPESQPERPKPYGTCSDCSRVCEDAQKQLKGEPYGAATCENGVPCYCVCADRIHKYDHLAGVKKANDIIDPCVAEHEKVHVDALTKNKCRPDGSEECLGDIKSLDCVQPNVGQCLSSSLDLEQQDRCLNRLLYYVQNYANCLPNQVPGKPPVPCKEDDAKSCAEKWKALQGEILDAKEKVKKAKDKVIREKLKERTRKRREKASQSCDAPPSSPS